MRGLSQGGQVHLTSHLESIDALLLDFRSEILIHFILGQGSFTLDNNIRVGTAGDEEEAMYSLQQKSRVV